MQITGTGEALRPQRPDLHDVPPVPRRPGTIPVTVRLDPPRYDRLKRLVLRLQRPGRASWRRRWTAAR